jgi:predicted RNase H-like nuclease
MDVYIGFDSAWTDNPKAPGAICAGGVENKRPVRFEPPELVSFDQALTFIHRFCSNRLLKNPLPGAGNL